MRAPVVFLFLLLLLAAPPLSLSSPSAAPAGIRELLQRLRNKMHSSEVQVAAARSLLLRLLPTHNSSFLFEIIPEGICGQYGCFHISNVDGANTDRAEILIRGTTAVEISSGLHWYLKYWCAAHISWDKTGGAQLGSVPQPGSLPRVAGEGVKIERPVPWNYYQNVVTSSYSYVWWDWQRWEKEIDWMALQGINLPLAFTGQEAIWKKVFQDFNVTGEHLNDFFGGPAFLAWARMGNLHGSSGLSTFLVWPSEPTSDEEPTSSLAPISRDLTPRRHFLLLCLSPPHRVHLRRLCVIVVARHISELATRSPILSPIIRDRQRRDHQLSLTITPPTRNTVDGNPQWCCTYLLDPKDPLFVDVGEAFIKQQIKEYGDITDIYNCDTFNENSPPTNDPTYISLLGAAVYKAMSKGDKDAVWLMQGWLFYSDAAFWKPPQMKALLHSVPIGKMIVLDLFAEVKPIWIQSSQFYGVPYVWCMLHNFGGNLEMYGVLDTISSGPNDARLSENSTMVGVGMCMEGIEHNPVVYELMSEMAFRSQNVDVKDWLKSYSYRRYGQAFPPIEAAWTILYQTIYNCTDGIADHNRDYIVEFPDLGPSLDGSLSFDVVPSTRRYPMVDKQYRFSLRETKSNLPQPHLWYSTKEVISALKLFLDAGEYLTKSATYRYDLVDLTRQVLSKLANEVYLDVRTAYHKRNVNGLNFHTQKFLELIEDIDKLLASDKNFLLGTWLESAKNLATTSKEKIQHEWNARTQVTMWYDNTKTNQSKLHDYANKFWSGLLNSYYLPRASTYFSYLRKSLQENSEFPLEQWREDWISYSNNWQSARESYSTEAVGDSIVIAKALFYKYFG
ncbi:alpha-N-acetylglucosaminidase-like [Zingiber officinale]|uniref:alpha-N-acetylglucosaminidase-like n=1 Tax=Zingiber officinale TaxID=94328 RepID=UPI001C4AF8E8|nr:alpha-N-acetylglucosaminidase-like [Zingiber officinale]